MSLEDEYPMSAVQDRIVRGHIRTLVLAGLDRQATMAVAGGLLTMDSRKRAWTVIQWLYRIETEVRQDLISTESIAMARAMLAQDWSTAQVHADRTVMLEANR